MRENQNRLNLLRLGENRERFFKPAFLLGPIRARVLAAIRINANQTEILKNFRAPCLLRQLRKARRNLCPPASRVAPIIMIAHHGNKSRALRPDWREVAIKLPPRTLRRAIFRHIAQMNEYVEIFRSQVLQQYFARARIVFAAQEDALRPQGVLRVADHG